MPLRNREKNDLRKLCLSFAPVGGAIPVSAEDVHLDAKVERFFLLAGRQALAGLRALLFLLEFMPVFSQRKRFSRMTDAEAVAYLSHLSESRSNIVQSVFLGLRGLLAPVFYAQREVREAMGALPHCHDHDD